MRNVGLNQLHSAPGSSSHWVRDCGSSGGVEAVLDRWVEISLGGGGAWGAGLPPGGWSAAERKACFDVGRSQLHASLKEQPVTLRMEEKSPTKQPEDLSMDRRDEFSGTRGKVARDFYRAASESKLLHQPTLWSVPQQPGEQGLAPWAWLPWSHTNPWGQKVMMALHGPRPHRGPSPGMGGSAREGVWVRARLVLQIPRKGEA